MGVTLYKPGGNIEIRGFKCQAKVFDEYSYKSNLDFGWFMSPEACYETEEQEAIEETTAEEEIQTEEPDSKAVSDKEIRQLAKRLGIKNWYNKGIEKLKAEIRECQDI